jgi:hypothetical protein
LRSVRSINWPDRRSYRPSAKRYSITTSYHRRRALLRECGKWPSRRAAQSSDEFAPSKANAHSPLLCREPTRQHSTVQACGGCQTGCCTAESRPPPPTGLWQRWVISTGFQSS